MAFSTKIFQIALFNSYYKSPIPDNDFEIHPTESTVSWMIKRKVRLLRYESGIILLWLSQNYDNPLELFKKKVEGHTISFIMTLQNNQLLNLAELEVGYSTRTVYYFHNRHNTSNHLLHHKVFVDRIDLVKMQTLPHEAMIQPGKSVFAMIDIDFSFWVDHLSKQKHNPIVYKIQIKNRATFWRYCFVDTQKQLTGTLRIVSNGDAASFGAVRHSTERPHTYWAESLEPIELCERYDYSLALSRRDKKNEMIVVEKLPYPTPYALIGEGSNKKKLYSDIVVYI